MRKLKIILTIVLAITLFSSCKKDDSASSGGKSYALQVNLNAYTANYLKQYTYNYDSAENDDLEIKDWRATIKVSKNADNTFNVAVKFSLCEWAYNFTVQANGTQVGGSSYSNTCGRSDMSVSFSKK